MRTQGESVLRCGAGGKPLWRVANPLGTKGSPSAYHVLNPHPAPRPTPPSTPRARRSPRPRGVGRGHTPNYFLPQGLRLHRATVWAPKRAFPSALGRPQPPSPTLLGPTAWRDSTGLAARGPGLGSQPHPFLPWFWAHGPPFPFL